MSSNVLNNEVISTFTANNKTLTKVLKAVDNETGARTIAYLLSYNNIGSNKNVQYELATIQTVSAHDGGICKAIEEGFYNGIIF